MSNSQVCENSKNDEALLFCYTFLYMDKWFDGIKLNPYMDVKT